MLDFNDTTKSSSYDANSPFIYNNNDFEASNKNILPFNYEESAINLIEFKQHFFSINEKALNILKSIDEEIIIVSIVGKARTGKSYLLNQLLSDTNGNYQYGGFEVASTINSCTKGIWLWGGPRNKPNSSAKILFIDSEGTSSVDLSYKTYDSKIFALIVLLSSLFIYNTTGNIDEKAVSELSLAAHLSNTIASNSAIDKDIMISDLAPTFIWVLRDFGLDKINPISGEELSSDEYLELCLRNKISGKNSSENNQIRENIIRYFKKRGCVTLPRPVESEKDLQNLNMIPFNRLKPEFISEFTVLKNHVYKEASPKIINGKRIHGKELAKLIVSFVNAINTGAVPNISTAWNDIVNDEIKAAYTSSLYYYKKESFALLAKDLKEIELQSHLYCILYEAVMKYEEVALTNPDIGDKASSLYNNYLSHSSRVQSEIEKEIKAAVKEKTDKAQKVAMSQMAKGYRVIDNKIFNNSYSSNPSSSALITDISSALTNNVNALSICSRSELMKCLIKNEMTNTRAVVYYLGATFNENLISKATELQNKFNQNEIEIEYMQNLDQVNDINQSLCNRIQHLKNDFDRKNKEIIHLQQKLFNLTQDKQNLRLKKKQSNDFSPNLPTKYEGEEPRYQCSADTCDIF